jgi:hypothetical protein
VTYVLAHDHLSINFAEGLAHDANLLGGDVVDVHEEALVVLVDGTDEVVPDGGLTVLVLLGGVKHTGFSEVIIIISLPGPY